MIESNKFVKLLVKKNIKNFFGVPDTCNKDFCKAIDEIKLPNYVAANEGVAISLGVGYYLAKKQIPFIYLQNSGLGNATDPLTNLCSKLIYKIPMVLLIGWRGAPGTNDEPQHNIQGKILKKTLKLLQIKFIEIKNNGDFPKIIKLINFAKKNSSCIAFIVKKGVFTSTRDNKNKFYKKDLISRKDIIELTLQNIKKNTKIISSVGFNSRELFQIRNEKNYKKGRDFMFVGAMGHTFAASMALSNFTKEPIVCIDGDGSFIMHLGALCHIKKFNSKKFKYIVLDNNSHESVGYQYTHINLVDLKKITLGFGFKNFYYAEKKSKLKIEIKKFLKSEGPSILHVKTILGTLPNLGRPKNFIKIKNNFMKT